MGLYPRIPVSWVNSSPLETGATSVFPLSQRGLWCALLLSLMGGPYLKLDLQWDLQLPRDLLVSRACQSQSGLWGIFVGDVGVWWFKGRESLCRAVAHHGCTASVIPPISAQVWGKCGHACMSCPPSFLSAGSFQIATDSVAPGHKGTGALQQFGGHQTVTGVRGAERQPIHPFHVSPSSLGVDLCQTVAAFLFGIPTSSHGFSTACDPLSSSFYSELARSPVPLIFFLRKTGIQCP